MAIIAKAHEINDRVIPIPFDFSPIKMKASTTQNIIISVTDIKDHLTIQKAYKYYGKENCRRIVSNLPSFEETKLILCVSSQCILNKINDPDNICYPDSNISPLWTEDRFGMSAEEAILIQKFDSEVKNYIQREASKVKQKLNNLKIDMDNFLLELIYECRQLIEDARENEEKASKQCRQNTAKEVAKFLRREFPVHAWIENIVEPVVLFKVNKEIDNDKALILGEAIDQVMSEIEPEDSQRFFKIFVYDACSWPVVINKTFKDDGKRNL